MGGTLRIAFQQRFPVLLPQIALVSKLKFALDCQGKRNEFWLIYTAAAKMILVTRPLFQKAKTCQSLKRSHTFTVQLKWFCWFECISLYPLTSVTLNTAWISWHGKKGSLLASWSFPVYLIFYLKRRAQLATRWDPRARLLRFVAISATIFITLECYREYARDASPCFSFHTRQTQISRVLL